MDMVRSCSPSRVIVTTPQHGNASHLLHMLQSKVQFHASKYKYTQINEQNRVGFFPWERRARLGAPRNLHTKSGNEFKMIWDAKN